MTTLTSASKVPIPIKIVLLGERTVGKTSIISQYTKKTFNSFEAPTTQSQFTSHIVTAGEEKYRSLTKIFYRDAACCILVYDITNTKSFTELNKYWIREVKDNVNTKNTGKYL